MAVISNWKELNINIKSSNKFIFVARILKKKIKYQENLCYQIQRGEKIYSSFPILLHETICPTKYWAIKNTVL